jgi:threonine aldolase
VQPAVVSLSQATEAGTLYRPDEVAAIAAVAREAGVAVHMDGARFANAVAALGCSPAELTWKAGVDALSFGATKGGAFACEAVVVFDPARARDLPFRRKRAGHLVSKGRFLGAQMEAWLEGGHWLDLAGHANAMAGRLSAGLAALPGVRLAWPTQANEVFAVLPRGMDAALRAAGARHYEWSARCLPADERPGAEETLVRLIASFATTPEEVDRFLDVARAAA